MTTERVRILVAIDENGEWVSAGYKGNANPHDWIAIYDLGTHMSYHWIEADVPIPQHSTLEGTVTDGK